MRKILVPTDGSEMALRAVKHAAQLAAAGLEVEIHLLNVQPPLPQAVTQFIPAQTLADYHGEEANKALADAEALLREMGLGHVRHLEIGRPGEKIAEAAAALGCDQIVMGTRGLSAISGLLLGSTTTSLLHLTSVPVTLIR